MLVCECVWVSCSNLEEFEVLEHVGHLLSVSSLVEEVELQRHVTFSLFYQPHERKVWKEPMNHLQEELTHTHIHTNTHLFIRLILSRYLQIRNTLSLWKSVMHGLYLHTVIGLALKFYVVKTHVWKQIIY